MGMVIKCGNFGVLDHRIDEHEEQLATVIVTFELRFPQTYVNRTI